MGAPQELKDSLLVQFHTGVDGVVGGVLDSSYDAGVAVGQGQGGGGFTQEQVDQFVASAITVERTRILTGLQGIDASEDAAVAGLINGG